MEALAAFHVVAVTLRSPEVNFRRSECRSADDMMMGTRQQLSGDSGDYFSTMDPSQLYFYDFGIQDFLVMKSHQNVVCPSFAQAYIGLHFSRALLWGEQCRFSFCLSSSEYLSVT